MITLKKGREFQCIYDHGKKTYGQYSLIFFNRNNLEYSRFGFVTSKKLGVAVVRNRIRRLLRQYIRANAQLFCDNNSNYDIIIVGKAAFGQNIKSLKYQDIAKDLDKIFKYSKIKNKKID